MIELMQELKSNQTLALRYSHGLYKLPKKLSDQYIKENNEGLYKYAPSKVLNDYLLKNRVILAETSSYPNQFNLVDLDDSTIPEISKLFGNANPLPVKKAIDLKEFGHYDDSRETSWMPKEFRMFTASELREIADYLDLLNNNDTTID